MKQTLEFKKDCIMKSYVEEVSDITLTHDYKVLEDTVEGYFDVSGSYKMSKSSIQSEEFMFTIPFTIALSSLIDKDSIDLKIEDFKYSIEKDVIHLDMFLEMDYEELAIEGKNNIDETKEAIDEILDEQDEVKEDTTIKEEIEEKDGEEMKEPDIKNEDTTKEVNSILNTFSDEKEFYNYKVYIMRNEDTLESVAIKYNVGLNDLKDYNNIENVSVGDKIIIPYIKVNEKE